METLANELVTAVELNDENIVRQLLRTARVDQCNEALIQTCTRGNKDILQAMIEGGCDVNSRSTGGKTCLMFATIHNHPECIKANLILVPFPTHRKQVPSMMILGGGEAEGELLLVNGGADVTLVDNYGQTAATHATNNDTPHCLLVLLEHGSSVNHQDRYGISLLMEAVTKDKILHAEAITQHGADIDLQDTGGMSALHWAASLGKYKSVELLYHKGANINLRSNDGKTPLVEAIGEDRYMCVKTLLKLGCDTNIRAYNGHAPIIYSAKHHHKCLELLLQHEGDRIQLEVNGESAMIHAILASNTENVRLLLKFGAAVTPVNTAGLSSQPWGAQDAKDTAGFIHLSVAAGVNHTLFDTHVGYDTLVAPFYFDQPNPKIPCALDKLCRSTIRGVLLHLNPRVNMFYLVKELPLPEPVKEFLLYDIGLDDYRCDCEECTSMSKDGYYENNSN